MSSANTFSSMQPLMKVQYAEPKKERFAALKKKLREKKNG